MNHQKGFSSIVIVLIIVVLLVGGIFAWQQHFWVPKEEVKVPEEVIEDETADWKTYRNEEYGFEVKYPQDFRVTNKEYSILSLETPDTKFEIIYGEFDGPFRIQGAEFKIFAQFGEKMTISQWIEKTLKEDEEEGYPPFLEVSTFNDKKVISGEIEGFLSPAPADVFSFLKKFGVEMGPHYKQISFYNEKNGVEITISFDTMKKDKAIYESIFNQILSTFRFTK